MEYIHIQWGKNPIIDHQACNMHLTLRVNPTAPIITAYLAACLQPVDRLSNERAGLFDMSCKLACTVPPEIST